MTICRKDRPIIACVPIQSSGPFPFEARGTLPDGAVSVDHMADPSDDRVIHDMELRMLLGTHVLDGAMLAPKLLSLRAPCA